MSFLVSKQVSLKFI